MPDSGTPGGKQGRGEVDFGFDLDLSDGTTSANGRTAATSWNITAMTHIPLRVLDNGTPGTKQNATTEIWNGTFMARPRPKLLDDGTPNAKKNPTEVMVKTCLII